MEKENCLTCKYGAYIILNKKEPDKSTIYCIKTEEILLKAVKCTFYQKMSI